MPRGVFQIPHSPVQYTASTVAANLAQVSAGLASTTNGNGASIIGVEDAGGFFTGINVESVLQEVAPYVMPQAQTITGTSGAVSATAIDLTKKVTILITTANVLNQFTLPDGTVAGQTKTIFLKTKGGAASAQINGTFAIAAGAGVTITMATVAMSSTIVWSGTAWYQVASNGSPALA